MRGMVLIAKERDRPIGTDGIEPSSRGLALLNLTVPCLDRSPFRLHPPMGGHRCGCL